MTLRTANSPYVCGWTLDDECCEKLAAAFDSKPELAQRCVDTAAEILYALSGRQFGLCELTVRPCRLECCDPCNGGNIPAWGGVGGYPWVPVLSGGQWTNVRCGDCGDQCSCSKVCDAVLPGPIDSVLEVKIDGEILPASAYRVDNHNRLVALKRPQRLEGDFQISMAGLDPTATLTADIPATQVVQGVDLGGGVYGPDVDAPNIGIIYLIWRGIDCVNLTYDGPVDAAMATSRPPNVQDPVGEAWTWPAPGFNFVAGTPVTSSVHTDGSSVVGTLVSGTAVTTNPNPPPQARNITLSPGTQIEFCPSQVLPFCWMTCQEMGLEDTEIGTWSVTYLRGKPIPAAGMSALAELACEICKACLGDKTCCLPDRVTSVNRQGISFTVLDPLTFVNEGRTGLYLVDLWLRAVNPKQLARRAMVTSVDMPRSRHKTWPTP